MTPEEKNDLAERAKAAGLTMGEFIRESIIGTDVHEAPSADVPQLIREIRCVGQNVNQLLIIARNYGFREAELLEATMSEVQEALDSVISAYTNEPENGRKD